jgi:hypothetical protein
MTEPSPRRRGPGFGEIIGLLALVISGIGVWISWQSISREGPTKIVEERQAIPLVLRGRVMDDGRTMVISPVEESHALQSLTISFPQSGSDVEVGSDGEISARAVENAINDADKPEGVQRAKVRLTARYVEAGRDRRSSGDYLLRYRWAGGGLFSGRSLRLEGISRS